jgi:hypothetical protein
VLASLLTATSLGAQGGDGGSAALVLLATAGDYPGETYTEGPRSPAEFVFFTHEPIAVDVSVANWGAAPMRAPMASFAAAPSVEVTLLDDAVETVPRVPGQRASGSSTAQTLLPVTSASAPAAESRRVPVSVTSTDGPWADTLAGSRVLAAEEVTMAPGDAVRWRLLLDGIAEPGLYRVAADVVDTGDGIRRQKPAFVVEVRAREEALPAELTRRQAEWLAARNDPGAYAATEALARVYPDSVVVHLIRSRLADAAGDETAARRELDAALDFMRHDRDRLFRRFARPGQIEDLIDSLLP